MADWYNARIPPWIGWTFVLLVLYLFLYWFANRSVYFPFRYPQGYWDQQKVANASDVWLTTSDKVRIHGWFASSPGSRIVTLFLHGNAGNVTHRIPHIAEVVRAGSSILVLDYRGYGRSEGSPGEQGLYRDADAGYEWLLRQGHAAEHIVIHGESLGSAVAVELASRKPCGAVVMEAPFNSASAVAGTVLPYLGPLLINAFDTKSRIRQVRVPKLIIHGVDDRVIPFRLGQDLYQAAEPPKELWVLKGADHNDILEVAGPAYSQKLREFYSRYLP